MSRIELHWDAKEIAFSVRKWDLVFEKWQISVAPDPWKLIHSSIVVASIERIPHEVAPFRFRLLRAKLPKETQRNGREKSLIAAKAAVQKILADNIGNSRLLFQ